MLQFPNRVPAGTHKGGQFAPGQLGSGSVLDKQKAFPSPYTHTPEKWAADEPHAENGSQNQQKAPEPTITPQGEEPALHAPAEDLEQAIAEAPSLDSKDPYIRTITLGTRTMGKAKFYIIRWPAEHDLPLEWAVDVDYTHLPTGQQLSEERIWSGSEPPTKKDIYSGFEERLEFRKEWGDPEERAKNMWKALDRKLAAEGNTKAAS